MGMLSKLSSRQRVWLVLTLLAAGAIVAVGALLQKVLELRSQVLQKHGPKTPSVHRDARVAAQQVFFASRIDAARIRPVRLDVG